MLCSASGSAIKRINGWREGLPLTVAVKFRSEDGLHPPGKVSLERKKNTALICWKLSLVPHFGRYKSVTRPERGELSLSAFHFLVGRGFRARNHDIKSRVRASPEAVLRCSARLVVACAKGFSTGTWPSADTLKPAIAGRFKTGQRILPAYPLARSWPVFLRPRQKQREGVQTGGIYGRRMLINHECFYAFLHTLGDIVGRQHFASGAVGT